MKVVKKLIVVALVLAIGAGIAWRSWQLLSDSEEVSADRADENRPVPVEVVAIEQGPIELRRTFSGTMEAAASFEVAPKVTGRVLSLNIGLADTVTNGQTVAVLDGDEYTQDLAQAQADLAVAEATLAEATNALEISDRTMQRQAALSERGIASDAQFDTAQAQQLAARAKLAVAEAQVQRAEAAVETTRIRLGYTQVAAIWSRGDDERIVAERWIDEGDTVAANTPLFTVVEIDPIVAVLYVAERDYAAMTTGLSVTLRSEAFPNETFVGQVARVAPIFESTSRQARVELTVPNPDLHLKPGMFVRSEVVLQRIDDAIVIPQKAVVRRDDQPVVFVIDPATQTARLVPVKLGIAESDRVQIVSPALSGQVVTLGQPLLDDGSAVLIAESGPAFTNGSVPPLPGAGAP